MQTTQSTEAPAEPQQEVDILDQVNAILNENRTLNDVVAEDEQAKQIKENEDALNAIVKEQTKDLPSEANTEVNAEATSSTEESDKLDEELRQ